MTAPTTTTNAAGATSPADSTAAADHRIYVSTYAKYNSGSIKGAWLDLSQYADRNAFLEACAELHKDETDPELMYQAFEGFPRAWYEESSAPPDVFWEWLDMSDDDKDAFGIYADDMGGDVTVDDFREAYQGTADSEADFAEQFAIETGSIPKDLPSWIVIDWKSSWSTGLRFDYWCDRSRSGGDLHFFRNI